MTRKRDAYVILGSHVIAVAKEGAVGDWAAYIDAVSGYNQADDINRVMEYGDKLPEDVARVLFPGFSDLKWRP